MGWGKGRGNCASLHPDAPSLSFHKIMEDRCRVSFTLTLTLKGWPGRTFPPPIYPWSPDPSHHITVRPREGKALVYNHLSLSTGDLVSNLLLFPTHSRRNHHLYHPKGITQSQLFGKWTGQKRELFPLSCFCVCVCVCVLKQHARGKYCGQEAQ